MENVKVNYFIGTWSGLRNNAEFDDGVLKRHLNKLDQLKHSLAQISIGHPYNPDERKTYTDWIMGLTQTAGGIPIKVHSVPNIGRSYGQWSRMFDIYRNQFTHYIFIEDDYVPVKDNFDQILVEMFEEHSAKNHCGFLCGLILDDTGRYGTIISPRHAAIANGISSNAVLNQVRNTHGCLPHDKKGYDIGQILFSEGFVQSGFTLQEYVDHFRCLYWQHSSKVRWYWDGKHNEDLIVPIQCLDRPDWEFEEYRPTTTPAESMLMRNPVEPIISNKNKRSFQINAQIQENAQQAAKKERANAIISARRRSLGR